MLNKKLIVAYFSPGWPLKDYPNGIVAYIQNIIQGFSLQVQAVIFTNNLSLVKTDNTVVGLSQLWKESALVIRLCDKALSIYLIPQYFKVRLQGYKDKKFYQTIVVALESLNIAADILEVAESFGVAKYLVNEIDIPIITRLHGPWFIIGPYMNLDGNYIYKARIKAEGEAIKLSDGITAPSLDVLNKVRDFYGLSLLDALVIPNSAPVVLKENQWQYEVDKKQTILVVGRFDLVKGGDLALDAFRIVAGSNMDVELLFVGPDRSVIIEGVAYSFNEYIDTFIPEKVIKERIKFLGQCSIEDVYKLRKNTSVTLMPSRYETFSISLVEALSVGSPVVACNVGGVKEILTNDFNGLLAEPESAESMAEKLLYLLGCPEKMQFFSKNAIRDSAERFSPSIVAKQTEAYYKQVITRSKR